MKANGVLASIISGLLMMSLAACSPQISEKELAKAEYAQSLEASSQKIKEEASASYTQFLNDIYSIDQEQLDKVMKEALSNEEIGESIELLEREYPFLIKIDTHSLPEKEKMAVYLSSIQYSYLMAGAKVSTKIPAEAVTVISPIAVEVDLSQAKFFINNEEQSGGEAGENSVRLIKDEEEWKLKMSEEEIKTAVSSVFESQSQ